MFILRRITTDCAEINIELGETYTMINSIRTPDHFKKLLKRSDVVSKDLVHSLIEIDNGKRLIPIFKNQESYIMCSDGKTFANVSRALQIPGK